MTLKYLTALHGLPRSIVDAEELQQQAEREFQNRSLGPHVPHFQCWGSVEPRMLGHPD